MNQSLLGEERVDPVTDHHQLAVPGGAVELQFSDQNIHSVRSEGESLTADIYNVHERRSSQGLLSDAPGVVLVGHQLGV